MRNNELTQQLLETVRVFVPLEVIAHWTDAQLGDAEAWVGRRLAGEAAIGPNSGPIPTFIAAAYVREGALYANTNAGLVKLLRPEGSPPEVLVPLPRESFWMLNRFNQRW